MAQAFRKGGVLFQKNITQTSQLNDDSKWFPSKPRQGRELTKKFFSAIKRDETVDWGEPQDTRARLGTKPLGGIITDGRKNSVTLDDDENSVKLGHDLKNHGRGKGERY